MGGRQWLLGNTISYTYTGSALRVTINGLTRARGSATHILTRWFILNINTKSTITLSVCTNWSPRCIRYFITSHSLRSSYILFLHHALYVLHILLQGLSSVAELIFYARGLDQSGRTRVSSSGWSDHLADGLHRQLIDRTFKLSLLLDVYFTADQLVGLLGARFFANLLVGFFIASSSNTLGTPRHSTSS
jgi:hypothetical protein